MKYKTKTQSTSRATLHLEVKKHGMNLHSSPYMIVIASTPPPVGGEIGNELTQVPPQGRHRESLLREGRGDPVNNFFLDCFTLLFAGLAMTVLVCYQQLNFKFIKSPRRGRSNPVKLRSSFFKLLSCCFAKKNWIATSLTLLAMTIAGWSITSWL